VQPLSIKKKSAERGKSFGRLSFQLPFRRIQFSSFSIASRMAAPQTAEAPPEQPRRTTGK